MAFSTAKAIQSNLPEEIWRKVSFIFLKKSLFILFCTGVTEEDISNLEDIFLRFNVERGK